MKAEVPKRELLLFFMSFAYTSGSFVPFDK